MNKRHPICNFIWMLAAIFSRIFYFALRGEFFGRVDFPGLSPRVIADTYGYFEYAMVRAGEERPVLEAGLSAGYAEHLSWLLRFTGNRLEAVGVCQLAFQILWLILFFAGMILLFGWLAGITAGSILMISPWILNTLFEVRPENYYMLYWAAALAALGCFHSRARDKGLNNWSRLCLLAMGFYLGVICIWNGISFYLPLWLLGAMAGGILCQWLFLLTGRKRAVPDSRNIKASIKEEHKMTVEEKPGNYFITEDGRKIRYIDNPLPGPKKHVKREMDFDINEFDDLPGAEKEQDDFDFEVEENDDFDW